MTEATSDAWMCRPVLVLGHAAQPIDREIRARSWPSMTRSPVDIRLASRWRGPYRSEGMPGTRPACARRPVVVVRDRGPGAGSRFQGRIRAFSASSRCSSRARGGHPLTCSKDRLGPGLRSPPVDRRHQRGRRAWSSRTLERLGAVREMIRIGLPCSVVAMVDEDHPVSAGSSRGPIGCLEDPTSELGEEPLFKTGPHPIGRSARWIQYCHGEVGDAMDGRARRVLRVTPALESVTR